MPTVIPRLQWLSMLLIGVHTFAATPLDRKELWLSVEDLKRGSQTNLVDDSTGH